MNSIQIQCFLTVARLQSVSRAAEELFLAQPSVSRYISQLEKEWEVSLFTRRSKGVALTPEGQDYYQLCSRYEKALSDLKQRHLANRTPARLSLHYSVFPAWNISRLLHENARHIQENHPNWELRLQICQAELLVQELLNGTVDAIFYIGTLLNDFPEIQTRLLLELPQMIIYSSESPLAGKPGLQPQDFREEDFLFVPDEMLTETMIGRQVRSMEKRYGFTMKTRLLENPDALSFALESNQGVALMDYWSRYRSNSLLKSLAIDLPLPVVLAWRKEHASPALQLFVQETEAFFREQVGE